MLSDIWKIELLFIGIPRYLYMGLGLDPLIHGKQIKYSANQKQLNFGPALLRCSYIACA